VKYPGPIGRAGVYVRELLGALRLRRRGRPPSVRVRLGDGEPERLPTGSPQHERLMSLAAELVAEDASSRRRAG